MYSLMRNLLLMGALGSIITVCKSDNIEVFNLCTTNKEMIKLGEEEAIITHEGYTSVEWCHWIIPSSVKEDHYAVILWLENISLPFPSTSSGCRGQLKIPGFTYDCEQPGKHIKNGACWVYTKEGKATCGANFIEEETTKKNLTCNSPLYWKNVGNPVQIGYYRFNGENHYKKFTIHYKPIRCYSTTTAAAIKTTSIEDTTASETSDTDKHTDARTWSSSTMASTNQESDSSATNFANACEVRSLPQFAAMIMSAIGGMILSAGIMAIVIKCQGGSFSSSQTQLKPPVQSDVLEDDGTYENPQQDMRNERGYEIPMNLAHYEKIDEQYERIRVNAVYDN